MKGFENINPEVAKDLIELVNSISGLEKTKSVNYPTKKGGITSFNYVPLDDILSKTKENNNFALMQPIGTDENGRTGVKCVLIHKSGHVIETDTYPFQLSNNTDLQAEGAEITYRKRYALGAFLGMSTEEDTDGNDSRAINVTERKATPRQIEVLLKNYNGELLTKLLQANNIDKIENLSIRKASELINKIMQKGGNKQ